MILPGVLILHLPEEQTSYYAYNIKFNINVAPPPPHPPPPPHHHTHLSFELCGLGVGLQYNNINVE